MTNTNRQKIEGYLAHKWGLNYHTKIVPAIRMGASPLNKDGAVAPRWEHQSDKVTIYGIPKTHPFFTLVPRGVSLLPSTAPYTILWTLDKPFSLVDATTQSTSNPNPLSRDHLITSAFKTVTVTSWPNASTYRINHVEPTFITDPDTTFFGVANPLIQGGGQKLLTHIGGTYSDYSSAIVPYRDTKRTFEVKAIENKKKKLKKQK